MEIAYECCNDKLPQIYFVGLNILSTSLSKTVCSDDVPESLLNEYIKKFVPLFIIKISELNLRTRDISMDKLISLFEHPSVDLKILIDNVVDIADGKVPIEKQQWRIVLARLEIMILVIGKFGLKEDIWSWRTLCKLLVFPSLNHQNPEVRGMCIELIMTLYKLIGEDVKNELIKTKNVKQSLLQAILDKMKELKVDGGEMPVQGAAPTNLKEDLTIVEEERD